MLGWFTVDIIPWNKLMLQKLCNLMTLIVKQCFLVTRGKCNMTEIQWKIVEFGRIYICTFLGYLGCQTNVIHIVDDVCSGKQQCDLQVSASELVATKPCIEGLKLYLEASYKCEKGRKDMQTIYIFICLSNCWNNGSTVLVITQ